MQFGQLKRREFISLLGGAAAARPLAARAQQLAIPVIGFLSFRSANESASSVAAFREGLSEIGYAEGRGVHIVFRWAEGQNDRLPMLASDLVDNLHVAVTVAAAGSAIAAKVATKTIPIVFTYHADPVKAGIVASLNLPEQNVTGIAWFGGDLTGKNMALLHDLVPSAATMALLVNSRDPEAQPELLDAQDAARRLNLKLVVLNAITEREIDTAFATAAQQQIGAVVVGSDPFLFSRREQIVGVAADHAIATVYPYREFVAAGGLVSYGNAAGGLVSYGNDVPEAYRHAGLHGRA
jgi:putative tryptophan/tyrosine transport system substrate-binding protein